MSFEVITWIVSALALTGTILNSSRNKWGFVLWFFTNLFWVIVDFKSGLYAQSALFLAYTVLAIKGIVTWTKKERQDKTGINVRLRHM